MATHDYVIANGTGAAVRSDLNGALAAIVSNNSNASEPATMYAYQWWADTTTGLLKQRNAANSAWVTIGTLASANLGLLPLAGGTMTGVLAVTAGTAALPGIAVSGDRTGIYSPGADQIGIATGGTSRIVVDASGNVNIDSGVFYVDAANNRVGIGNTSPGEKLSFGPGGGSANSAIQFPTGNAYGYLTGVYDSVDWLSLSSNYRRTGASGTIGNASLGTTEILQVNGGSNSHYISFGLGNANTAPQERARIDSSGRLLVGTTSSSVNTTLVLNGSSGGAGNPGIIYFQRNEAAPGSGSNLGMIYFSNNAGNSAALISSERDTGTWTSGSSHPGRLVFSTTADGASSPTERMRISQNGQTNIFSSDNGLVTRVSAGAGTTAAIHYGTYSATNNTNGTVSFVVWSNGNVQNTNNSYGAYSDAKLKENIVDATSQWSDIKALQVRKYNFKEGQTHTQIGLVAQEVELISPGLVSESPDRDENGNDLGTVTKSVNYSVLYMKAVKALQEAMERIEALEADVAALKGA